MSAPGVRTGSLRRRVLLPTLAVVALVVAVFAVVVTSLLGAQLRGDLRDRLADRAGYAVVLQESGVTGQDLADELSGGGVFVSFASDGTDYVGRDVPEGPAAPPRPGGDAGPGGVPRLPQPAVEPAVNFVESDGALTATVALTGGTVTLATTEDSVDRTLATLRTIQIAVGLGALALTAAALWQVVSVSLRPLDRMTSLARHIQAGARNRRLRPTHPHTELGRTAAAFDDMLDELESAETAARSAEATARSAEGAMRRFLADASHDLRTPLAGVVAAADGLLRADPDTMTRAEQEARLVAIVRQGRQAARLVDDLLTMARLDAEPDGRAAPGPAARPAAVIAAVLDDLALRRPDVRLIGPGSAPDGCPPVSLPADDLRRILVNLLDNAAAAAGSGGTVQVDLWVSPPAAGTGGPDAVHVTVIDDGPGVPAAERERVFDRFVRLADARSGTGSGLGLPIARRLARRAGGELVCRTRPDGRTGGCFVLTVPTRPAGASDVGAADPGAPDTAAQWRSTERSAVDPRPTAPAAPVSSDAARGTGGAMPRTPSEAPNRPVRTVSRTS